MDQLKQIFANLKKHIFWIAVGLAMVLGFVGWYFMQGNLQKLYTDQENLIKGKYGDMDRVRAAVSTHPNESSKSEMERIIKSLSEDVQKAWDEQYQRQTTYMNWPDIGLPALIDKLKRFYPVELKLTYPDEPANTITEGERTSFSKYFDEQMPKLAEIIGVQWGGSGTGVTSGLGGIGGLGGPPGGMSGGGPPSSSGFGSGDSNSGGLLGQSATPRSKDVVIWPKAAQADLLRSIRLWQGDKPDIYEMIYTQENMWILEGLLNIIAQTNIVPETGRPATANVQAAIKQIDLIRIGRSAIGDVGNVLQSTVSVTGSAGGGQDGGFGGSFGGGALGSGGGPLSGKGMTGGPGGPPGSSGGGGAGGGGQDEYASTDGDSGDGGSSGGPGGNVGAPGDSGGGGFAKRDPAHRRYVDLNFKPIPGDDLRTRVKSESPDDANYAVAKRVPVRMRVKMDMRRLQDFLVNCGNAGLMLEVRQVRIGDTSGKTAGSGASGPPGGMAGGPPSSTGAGSGGPMGGRGGAGGAGAFGANESPESPSGGPMGGLNATKARRSTNDMNVEIYGVVYLFYPVHIERLGLNKVDENFSVEGTSENAATAEETADVPLESPEDVAPEPGEEDDPEVEVDTDGNPAEGSTSDSSGDAANGLAPSDLPPAESGDESIGDAPGGGSG